MIARPRSRRLLLISWVLGGALAATVPALAQDFDGDGVPDHLDLFPCDPTAAAEAFAPSQGEHAMLFFEDLWPAHSDLDFNDLVLAYNYAFLLDGQSRVVRIRLTLNALALGGTLDNGLGVHLPLPRSAVSSVTRRVGAGAPSVLQTQSGETEATFVVSQNLRELFGGAEGAINSLAGEPVRQGETIEVEIELAAPVATNLGLAPFDIYLFRSGSPGHETHRPQYPGTAAMPASLFAPGIGHARGARRFVDQQGLPFVLHVPNHTRFPRENAPISSLFPDIVGFAASAGASHRDFYTSQVRLEYAYDVMPLPFAGFISGDRFAQDGECLLPTCSDGAQNGAETGVDCGGGDCPACGERAGCASPSDCQSAVCVGGLCMAAACDDGVRNGGEADVDCGGPCSPCGAGRGCQAAADCASGVCSGGVCQAPSCSDGIRNGAEVDVDCGASCGACAVGRACNVHAECASVACAEGRCVAPTCVDSILNQSETDVDCGGAECLACQPGRSCALARDCRSSVCLAGVCQAASCSDGVQNGGEVDVDCGGSCAPCAAGRACTGAADCASGVCSGGVCQAPTCFDRVQNGAEVDVDCGGVCPACGSPPVCPPGDFTCSPENVALSALGGVAMATDSYGPNPPSSVNDGLIGNAHNGWGNNRQPNSALMVRFARSFHIHRMNMTWGGNTAGGWQSGRWLPVRYRLQYSNDAAALVTDSVESTRWTTFRVQSHNLATSFGRAEGGHIITTFRPADWGRTLAITFRPVEARAVRVVFDVHGLNADWWQGLLNEWQVIAGLSCRDGLQNAGETAVDCGGPTCAPCTSGSTCALGRDCTSGVCGAGGVCVPPSCSDGVSNGAETDVDCGGGCGPCGAGAGCFAPTDCASSVCQDLMCRAPTCSDGVTNGAESDVDCGGQCAGCPSGRLCSGGSDCTSLVCAGGYCQAPTCSDGVRNGGESGVDCGGSTCGRCPVGETCAFGSDCASGACSGGVCQAPSCNDGVMNGDETGVDCGGSCNACNVRGCQAWEAGCVETNVGLAANGAVASASDTYSSNPVSLVNDGFASGSHNGWGNGNVLNSRVMLRFPAVRRLFAVDFYWGGNGTGGWQAGSNYYLPTRYYLQVTTDPAAVVSDPPASPRWSTVTQSEHGLTTTQGALSGPNLIVNAPWGTWTTFSFFRTNALAVRAIFDGPSHGGSLWIGTLGEVQARAVNQ